MGCWPAVFFGPAGEPACGWLRRAETQDTFTVDNWIREFHPRTRPGRSSAQGRFFGNFMRHASRTRNGRRGAPAALGGPGPRHPERPSWPVLRDDRGVVYGAGLSEKKEKEACADGNRPNRALLLDGHLPSWSVRTNAGRGPLRSRRGTTVLGAVGLRALMLKPGAALGLGRSDVSTHSFELLETALRRRGAKAAYG